MTETSEKKRDIAEMTSAELAQHITALGEQHQARLRTARENHKKRLHTLRWLAKARKAEEDAIL